jgi:hypothetical protein
VVRSNSGPPLDDELQLLLEHDKLFELEELDEEQLSELDDEQLDGLDELLLLDELGDEEQELLDMDDDDELLELSEETEEELLDETLCDELLDGLWLDELELDKLELDEDKPDEHELDEERLEDRLDEGELDDERLEEDTLDDELWEEEEEQTDELLCDFDDDELLDCDDELLDCDDERRLHEQLIPDHELLEEREDDGDDISVSFGCVLRVMRSRSIYFRRRPGLSTRDSGQFENQRWGSPELRDRGECDGPRCAKPRRDSCRWPSRR